MSDNTRNNNNTTLVWGCIGRSCALCKKDHKACNGARPCSRCIGMGWESECRDVALKPRGRPRKTRSKAKGPAATTSSKGSSINADEDDQPLSVSPSLFVTSFPFLSTTGPKGDISEKVSKLTQRLGGSHVPAVSSGLRSDAASPKVNRKRRAVGPSSACEAAAFSSNKRREIVEEEEVDEEEVIEEVDRDELKNNNNHNNHNHNNNTHNNDDEVDDFAVDEDEPDVEEGLIPYEMVFRVNLVSSCSTSSKKQTDNNNNNNTHNNAHNNNKKASSSTTKKKTSSCSHNNTHNTRNKSPAKEAGFERKVLKQIEEEVDMGLFRLDFANASAADVSDNNHNNTHTFGSVASASVAMDTATPHQACLGSEEEMIDSFSCAEQYVQEYWQQHNHHNNHNHNNHNNTCGMLDSTYILQQQQQQTQQQPQQHNFSFFMDSMGITSTANASFMFLKTEPMALAQEEKLGRNPYFIRTPPQLRRCVQGSNPTAIQTASLVDCMEDEDAWF